ncbi:MAG: transcription termination factor NusA [Bacilli bacterium]|nr:transcription termination factor NusA [Bacilli bacterium]
MDAVEFRTAVNAIAETKGIDPSEVVSALKEALEKAYIKYLGGGDDAEVLATIDEENGAITVCQFKNVVEEVEDDYLEISLEDAKEDYEASLEHLKEEYDDIKKSKKVPQSKKNEYLFLIEKVKEEKSHLKYGEKYAMYAPLTEMGKLTINAVKATLKMRIAESERSALYEIYKDHIGEIITGRVEKYDDKSALINIGRTTVELTRKAMIGNEDFTVGETVKVYIQEVKSVTADGKPQKGPQIEITRSSEGFLKRLFEEEIHEIFEGTVLIKGIAREAGVRSKVAVYSSLEDVDATGSCIGPGGSRIQKIVGQLGNSNDKEKIDVIAWSENPGLFIAEALRPATVIGVAINEPDEEDERPSATAIVKDEALSVAIGKKGANARLANKLTGYSIDVITLSVAEEDGIKYTSIEDLKKSAEEEKKVKARAAFAAKSFEEAAKKAEVAPAVEVTPIIDTVEVEEETVEEVAPSVEVAPVVEEAAPAPAVEEPVKPVEPTIQVKTTKTIEDLEASLSSKPAKKQAKPDYKKKRPHQISDDEVEPVKPIEVTVAPEAMPIYTEEELAEIEREESMYDDEDYIDPELYDDYDEDNY